MEGCAPRPLRHVARARGGRRRIPLVAALLLASLAGPTAPAIALQARPSAEGDLLGQERGTRGTVHAEVADSLAGPRVVHTDGRRRCRHALVGLAGAREAGFVALWRDERDGIDSIYMARLAPDGERLGPDRPIHGPDSDHLHDEATAALTPAGALGIAWVVDVGRGREVRLRVLTEEGEDLEALPLGPARTVDPELGPQLTVGGDGAFALSTHQGHRPLLRRFEPDRTPRGPVLPLGAGARPALGPPQIAQSAGGDVLAAWNGPGGLALEVRTAKGQRRTLPLVPGQLRDVAADPAGGWFVLVQAATRLVLEHRDAAGHVDRAPTAVSEGLHPLAHLAVWDGGVAVLAELLERDHDRRTRFGPITLHLLAADGTVVPERRPLRVVADESRRAAAPRLASCGDRLLLAWNERRGANADVYYRVLGAGGDEPRPGPVRRLNEDVSSSHQRQGDVDADGGRAAVAWLDDRSGRDRAYVRLLGADGAFLTDEIAVPAAYGRPPGAPGARDEPEVAPAGVTEENGAAPGEIGATTVPTVESSEPGTPGSPDGERTRRNRGERGRAGPRASRPTVCLGSDGGFLATWKEQDRQGFSLFAQAFGPRGGARSAAAQVDPGFATPPTWAAAAAAIPGARGYLLVWVRDRVGVCLVRLGATGVPAGDVEILSETRNCRNPSIARLDDRRFVVAWDVARDDRVNDMRGRFLLEDGRLDGPELRFARSRTSYDADPCVAPAGRGTFLLVWVGRSESDRDVYARLYDRRGTPQGRPLAVTTRTGAQDQPSVTRLADGSWAVAWRDDLSGSCHALVRRIAANGRDLGPVRRLHGVGAAFVDATLDPGVAALGGGLVATWSDVRRSRGFDVVVRILGAGFDAGTVR